MKSSIAVIITKGWIQVSKALKWNEWEWSHHVRGISTRACTPPDGRRRSVGDKKKVSVAKWLCQRRLWCQEVFVPARRASSQDQLYHRDCAKMPWEAKRGMERDGGWERGGRMRWRVALFRQGRKLRLLLQESICFCLLLLRLDTISTVSWLLALGVQAVIN